jgi:mono/diheme cytochrome c family protein
VAPVLLQVLQRTNKMQMRLGIIVAFGVVMLVAFPAGHQHFTPNFVQQSRHAAHGRELIASSGCLACHEIPGFEGLSFRGPRLDSTGAKLRPEWLRAWLRNPHAVSARSRMGDFRLSVLEAAAIEAFLLSQQTPVMTVDIKWRKTDPANGRALFTKLRCGDCHGAGDDAATSGLPLRRIGEKVRREWLAAFLRWATSSHCPPYRQMWERSRTDGQHLNDMDAPDATNWRAWKMPGAWDRSC